MFVEIVLLLLLALVYFIIRDRKPANMPPGPAEIPFFGQMPFFSEEVPIVHQKKYGDLVTVRAGYTRTVLVFDYKTAKETMGSMDFVDRPAFFNDLSLDPEKKGGLVGSNGIQWQHDRRFALRNLRNLGMGKSYLEVAINTEAQALVEDLKMYKEKPIKFPDSLRTVALNIIWQMVAGRRYDLRSKEVDLLYSATNEFQSQSVLLFLPMFFPIITYIVPKFVRNKLFKEDLLDTFISEMRNIVQGTVTEHEKNFDASNPTSDFTDEYLKAKEEQKDNEDSLFRNGALLQIVNDLFGAGSHTVNNMLKWIVFLLARHKDYAKRLREQIDSVVPRGQMVSLTDKPNLPLVDAFVVEALRYSSMIILNVQRSATRDTTINGYFVPKDTVVTVVNYCIHHDPRYWKNPHKFYPERFIDDDGKFQAPKENFMAFGLGRRQCVGELLARMELFLFSAAIAQNMDIVASDGVTLDDKFNNIFSFRVPMDHELIYKLRSD